MNPEFRFIPYIHKACQTDRGVVPVLCRRLGKQTIEILIFAPRRYHSLKLMHIADYVAMIKVTNSSSMQPR